MRRAFSLLEVMIAAALGGVVLAASVQTSATIQRTLGNARKTGLLIERRELLEEFFGPLLRQTGQSTIKPWEAVLTKCTPDCKSQRVHIMKLASFPHQTLSLAWDGKAGSIQIETVGGVCPLTVANGFKGATNIVLVPASTSASTPTVTFTPGWTTRTCTPTVDTCTCALLPVVGVTDDTETAAAVAVWGKARVAIGQTVTLARDAVANELLMRSDFDDDQDRDEVRMANGVHGIDLAYGIIQADDSMLFQSTIPVSEFSNLRMVRLELALGTTLSNGSSGSVVLTNGTVTVADQKLTRSNTVAFLATAASL